MFAFPEPLLVDSWEMAGSQRGRLDCGAQMAKFRLIFGFSPKADKEPGLGCLSLGSSAPTQTHTHLPAELPDRRRIPVSSSRTVRSYSSDLLSEWDM